MTEHAHYPSHPKELAQQDAFRAARADGLYSTDSVAILQLSRYASPLSVYLDKTEPIPPATPASLQAWLGWRLEDSLAQLYAERYGVAAPHRMKATYAHPVWPFIKTHLDYARLRQGILVETKTRTHRTGWGEDGTGKVPPDVWVQAQHELLVMRAIHPAVHAIHIPVLFGLHTFHVYELEADEAFHERLAPELEAFWEQHVLARVAPAPVALGVDIAWSRRHPQETTDLASITPDQERLLHRVRMAALAVSQAKAHKDALDAEVRDLIGKRGGLMGRFGTVTNLATKGTTDHERLARTYLGAYVEANRVATMRAQPEDVQQLELVRLQVDAAPGLYSKPGSRTMRYTWAEGDE